MKFKINFTRIAQELSINDIYAELSDLVNSIENNKDLYLKSETNYAVLIDPILRAFNDINSKNLGLFANSILFVLKQIFIFFNNLNIKPNRTDVDLANKLKSKTKQILLQEMA